MASGIERVLSVDDLVGNIWRLQNGGLVNMAPGMGRTDSEAAFQEFLKRIPSASNLAAIAGSAGHLSGALEGALPSSANLLPGAQLSADLGAGSFPRVSSLDFLARLLPTHQAPFSPNAAAGNGHVANGPNVKLEPGTAPLPITGIGHEAFGANHPAALPGAMLHPMAPMPVHPIPHHHPALAAAAALQLQGQLGHLTRMAHPPPMPASSRRATSHNTNTQSATDHSDHEHGDQEHDKSDTRRQRRMLSNRESARRSRRRKQEHLNKLEQELNEMSEEKKAAVDRAQSLERRCCSIEEENKRLREENERLRDELRFLRNEFTDRKERNGWRRELDDHDRERERDGPPASKRGRGGDDYDRRGHGHGSRDEERRPRHNGMNGQHHDDAD